MSRPAHEPILEQTTPRWVQRWLSLRYLAALVGLLVFTAALPLARQLTMDRQIDAMFDPDDPTLLAYQDMQSAFGGNAVVMMVYRDANLMTPEGLDRSDQLSVLVKAVPGVQDVLSPARISQMAGKLNPQGLFAALATDPHALLRQRDVIPREIAEIFAGYTHAADFQRAAVVALLEPDHSPATIDSLRDIGDGFFAAHQRVISDIAFVGEPVLIHDGFTLIERDGAKLATWTITLLSIVVLISMFDLRFVLLMAMVVHWSSTVTRALLVVLSIELSLVSTILRAIVTVIAVTAVLHLGVRFRTARQRGQDRRTATAHSLARLTIPIFWTCATDAAGFVALSWSRIVPVQQFGQMIAIAAGVVFVGLLLFAPVVMMLPSLAVGQRLVTRQQAISRRLRRGCERIAGRFVRSPRWTIVTLAVVTIITAGGIWRTETETSFLNNFRSTSPIVSAYTDVEQNLGGAGVWDVVVDAPREINETYLTLVRDLQRELRRIEVHGESLTKVLSIADLEAVAAKSRLLRIAPVRARLAAMRVALPAFSDALLTPVQRAEDVPAPRRLRIMLRSREQIGADQKMALIDAVRAVVKEHTGRPAWQEQIGSAASLARVTGYYVMMAELVRHLVQDQWRCFIASGVLVWCLLWLATRSLRLATAALFPNLLPALLVLAIVGMVGGKINMGAAMIAAVSIGLSIDGSVHLLTQYRELRRRSHSPSTSAIHAAGRMGVPVLLATVALIVGFSVLATSEFVPTSTFGILVAATMAAGTIVNLTLLPAFVAWIDR